MEQHDLTIDSRDDLHNLFVKLHEAGEFKNNAATVELAPRNYLNMLDKVKQHLGTESVETKFGDYTVKFVVGMPKKRVAKEE